MPMGKGTYGKKKGRPPKMTVAAKKKAMAKLKKKPTARKGKRK